MKFFFETEMTPASAPHPRYAQIAEACRACGMDLKDDDFELIDAMAEEESSCTPDDARLSAIEIDILPN